MSFGLDTGEIVGLVGDNGAGKSTLVKCIAGVVRPTEGAIHLSGTRHEFATPAEAREAGVETVYQDLALVEMFDLAANLFLGRELVRDGWLAPLGILRKREMQVAARAAIAQLPARFPDLEAPIDTMSGGQRQVGGDQQGRVLEQPAPAARRADCRARGPGIGGRPRDDPATRPSAATSG